MVCMVLSCTHHGYKGMKQWVCYVPTVSTSVMKRLKGMSDTFTVPLPKISAFCTTLTYLLPYYPHLPPAFSRLACTFYTHRGINL